MKKRKVYTGLGALLILLTMAGKLIYDLAQWKKGKYISHTKEWLICLPLYGFGCYLLAMGQTELNTWLSLPLSIITGMGTVWFLFDGLYQIGRGIISKMPKLYPFFGLGSIDPGNDAKSDNFLRKFSKNKQILIKTLVFLVPIIIYILTLHNGF